MMLKKSNFCRELQIDSGLCGAQCGNLIRFVLSSLLHCFFYGRNIAFLLGLDFYGSGIFIVPVDFFSDIEEAIFGVVLH